MKKLHVYYDNWCPNCTRFIKIIKKYDTIGLIEARKIREKNTLETLDIEKAKNKMASTVDEASWNYGFKSLYLIFKRIPLFWISIPLMYFLKLTRLGDFLYNELAERRNIIPLHCDEYCEIN